MEEREPQNVKKVKIDGIVYPILNIPPEERSPNCAWCYVLDDSNIEKRPGPESICPTHKKWVEETE